MSDVAECRTADDVRRATERVRAFRKSLEPKRRPPSPKPEPIKLMQLSASCVLPVLNFKNMWTTGTVTARLQGVPEKFAGHSIHEIQDCVCTVFATTRNDLISAKRYGPLIPPRHIAIMLAAHLTPLSYPAIGRQFNRDHTSIMHAVRKMRPVLTAIDQSLTPQNSAMEWTIGAVEAYRAVRPHSLWIRQR